MRATLILVPEKVEMTEPSWLKTPIEPRGSGAGRSLQARTL